MDRDLARLTRTNYDLVIIGGGIYGICAAWDATLRGLSVAIVERGDFCGATSANSLKLVHGGFRYIQHADIRRIRESSHERNTLMRIAPHLVSPIPFLIPTYGRGMKGKEILTFALALYNLIAFDRNQGLKDPRKQLPWGEIISRDECLRLFPALERKGLTGGVVFYDGQMYNPPRLALAYLKSAAKAGAEAANYLEVTGFLGDRSQVTGVKARDLLTGNDLEIRGKLVLNASGPWAEQILEKLDVRRLCPPLYFSKDLYLVIGRPLTTKYALAVPSKHTDPNAIVSRGQRHLFLIPWRDYTLIGSSHLTYEGRPDEFAVTDTDIQELLDEINISYPAVALTHEDISFFNAGLVPMDGIETSSNELKLSKRHRIIDHETVDGLAGLVTVVSVRWTTSRHVAQETIDLVFRKLGQKSPKVMTAVTPLYGGQIERLDEFLKRESQKRPFGLSVEVMDHLLRNHGSAYSEVLQMIEAEPDLGETIGASKVLKVEVVHAIRAEMAQKLGDVVFRRTDLGVAGHPGESALRTCAALMAAELKWDKARVERELDEVRQIFPCHNRVF
jgi:glycerol-3-phosphate dehydrogenase